MPKKSFHVGDVLSVVTHRAVSPRHIDGARDLLQFMTGDEVSTLQFPRVFDECRPYLLKQFPELDSPQLQFAVGELDLILKRATSQEEKRYMVLGWLSKITCGKYGIQIAEMLEVEALPSGVH